MTTHNTGAKFDELIHNNSLLFWVLQFVGWMGISLISYFSLNLWYNQPELSYLAHNLVQSLLGIIISWPLRWLFHSVWNRSWITRLTVITVSVLFFALLWSVARLLAFLALTDETGLWSDFGGWYYPSIFIFLCWTALYHSIKYYQLLQEEHRLRLQLLAKQKTESLKRSEAESQAKEALLKMLRYQINPHFLFNTMNSVLALVTAKKNDRAQQMILQLSDFLRYSLSDDIDQQVPLEKEVEALEKYLLIEQARFGERLQLSIDIDSKASSCLVPSLLLQPLLENAIKYAIAPSESGGHIRISAKYVDQQLEVYVEDSGAQPIPHNELEKSSLETSALGLGSSAQHQKSTGLGLKNIKSRLETLYPEDHTVEFSQSDLGGTKVIIKLPATYAKEY